MRPCLIEGKTDLGEIARLLPKNRIAISLLVTTEQEARDFLSRNGQRLSTLDAEVVVIYGLERESRLGGCLRRIGFR